MYLVPKNTNFHILENLGSVILFLKKLIKKLSPTASLVRK
jgi:hypothetical protein